MSIIDGLSFGCFIEDMFGCFNAWLIVFKGCLKAIRLIVIYLWLSLLRVVGLKAFLVSDKDVLKKKFLVGGS